MNSMLKVSFWSPFREKGVTTNMIAIAMATNQYFKTNIGLRSNHISKKMLDYYISQVDHRIDIVASETESFSRDAPQYLHYLLWYDDRFHTKADEKRILISRKDSAIYIYRPPEPYDRKVFPTGDEELMFLDLSGRNNSDSYKAMREADFNVIFLPVDMEEIKEFFKEKTGDDKKNIYVINGYSSRCEVTPKNIRNFLIREYGIKRDKIMFIPYYERLKRFCHLGELDLMLLDEGRQRKSSLYYKCVKEIGKALLMCKVREKC